MNLLRAIVFFVLQVLTVIPVALAMVLSFWAPWRVAWGMAVFWLRINMWGLEHICGIRWQVLGKENLPDEPVILLSKHQSTWETFFFPTYMPRELCYVFKRELLYIPFFGWGIALCRMIHINRSKGSDAFEQVVSQGTQKLAEGRWIIMFPEGTRTKFGSQGIYKTGGPRLSIRTGAKVVPIAHNAGKAWPRKSFVKTPGLVTVSIGPPISPTLPDGQNKTPDALLKEVETWIEAEMRRISPDAY